MGKTLKRYMVCSHVDKPLETEIPSSKYEIPIQAGAALTQKRICEINDYDGFAESISNRNRRYSECTAIYWIGKHIDSDYVGVEHYRRRFQITDEVLELHMNQGVDIITTQPMKLDDSIQMDYVKNHYGGDWAWLMEYLKEYDPNHYEFYAKEAENHEIHFGNINIMKAELFRKYCQWAFPVVDAYYRIAPEKLDKYNRRDAGFIMERLSHFFVMREMKAGKKVVECQVKNYSNHAWSPEDECDVKNMDEVYTACNRLYDEGLITKCCNVLGEAMKYGAQSDARLNPMANVLYAGIYERMRAQTTMYEYLPDELKKDLSTLCNSFEQFTQMVVAYVNNPTDEVKALFQNYLQVTGFSMILVDYILDELENKSK